MATVKDWEIHDWMLFVWITGMQLVGLWGMWVHNVVLGLLLTAAAWGLSWQQRQ